MLGAAIGAGVTTAVLVPRSTWASTSTSAERAATQSRTAASTTTPLSRPPEVVRVADPAAFAPPFTDAVGMSTTVLRPEKVKGGVRFTIALANTSDVPIMVDTGAMGPHDPRFNDVAVPMNMTPVRKKLVPGEGYVYQCVFKLPNMDAGQVAFSVGQIAITGQAAGD